MEESVLNTVVRMLVIVLLAPIAWWAEKIDAANDSIICNTVIATVSSSDDLDSLFSASEEDRWHPRPSLV